jgi:hypothetical protein
LQSLKGNAIQLAIGGNQQVAAVLQIGRDGVEDQAFDGAGDGFDISVISRGVSPGS